MAVAFDSEAWHFAFDDAGGWIAVGVRVVVVGDLAGAVSGGLGQVVTTRHCG